MAYARLNEILVNTLTAFAQAEAEVNKNVLNQLLAFCELDEGANDKPVYRVKETIISYNRTVVEKGAYKRDPVNLIVPTAALVPFSAFRVKKTRLKVSLEVKSQNTKSNNKEPLFRATAPACRKSDRGAKMEVNMETGAVDLPEGFSRIIDILYSSINRENKTDHEKAD
jgi:hypothetical protein